MRKLGMYLIPVAIGSLTTLLVIPIIIAQAGAKAWTGYAVGQGVGALALVFIAFGWGVLGPATASSLPEQHRYQYYADSVVPRLMLLAVSLPVIVAVCSATAPQGASLAVACVAAVSVAATGTNASWFYVGEASPGKLIMLDAVPRLAATVVGLVALVVFSSLLLLAAIQLAGELVISLLGISNATRRGAKVGGGLSRMRKELAGNASGVAVSFTAAAYVQVPMVVVAGVGASAIDSYALADRILKFSQRITAPVTQVAQGWVPRSEGSDDLRWRCLRAIYGALGCGIAASAAFAVGAPILGNRLSHGQVVVSVALSVPLGLALGAVVISRVVGLAVLISLGRRRHLVVSTVLGAVIGLPLTVGLTVGWGAVGAAWSIAVAELGVLLYQLIAAGVALRTEKF